MTHRKEFSDLTTNVVDWSNPQLESLLQKTESWQLDNRGTFTPQQIHIQIGTGDASISEAAVLVWENEGALVIQTRFPVQQGENVRVDKPLGNDIQALWGAVIESRAGNRSDDQANDVHLHWLRKR